MLGQNLIVSERGRWSIVDPATGRRTHSLSLIGSYATDDSGFLLQPGVLADDGKLLDVSAKGDNLAISGAKSWRIVALVTGRVSAEKKVDELLVGAGYGTVVTLSDTDGNPKLQGIDIDTGRKSWQYRFYSDPEDMEGFSSSALFMDTGRLAITSRPGLWDAEQYFGAPQTRLVDLSTGDATLLESVSALGLGKGGMLGFVHPAKGEPDSRARLAYYPL